jgi:hypothetical protein
MAEAINQVINQAQNDFWRAPVPVSAPMSARERSSTCNCGTEFIVSSLYCHACGARRPGMDQGQALEIPGLSELTALAENLGLSAPALVGFGMGIFCMLGALTVGVFFSARTLVDWQAIQLWRLEWLVAAIACFAGGCVLKK